MNGCVLPRYASEKETLYDPVRGGGHYGERFIVETCFETGKEFVIA
jgi:hypothetical protein